MDWPILHRGRKTPSFPVSGLFSPSVFPITRYSGSGVRAPSVPYVQGGVSWSLPPPPLSGMQVWEIGIFPSPPPVAPCLSLISNCFSTRVRKVLRRENGLILYCLSRSNLVKPVWNGTVNEIITHLLLSQGCLTWSRPCFPFSRSSDTPSGPNTPSTRWDPGEWNISKPHTNYHKYI